EDSGTEDRMQQEQREAGLGGHPGDAADRDVRAAGAVEELQVEVDRLPVPAEPHRHLAIHLVEIQRLCPLLATGPAYLRTRQRPQGPSAPGGGARWRPGPPRAGMPPAIPCPSAGSTRSAIRKTSEPKLAPSCRARTWVTPPATVTGPTPGPCRAVTTTSSSCR